MKRVLILDGSIHPEFYRPVNDWKTLLGAVAADVVHLPSGERVRDLATYSHVIVTGSEASIVNPEPWYEAEIAAVREAHALGLPMLGSCFGHQMLALALSGPSSVSASATPEVGWIPIHRVHDDPLFASLPDPFHVFASHFDEVRFPPPPWCVLLKSADCGVQAMRYGDKPIWGIQAHPEITPERAITLMKGFLGRHPEKGPIIKPALVMTPKDDGAGGVIVNRFLESTRS